MPRIKVREKHVHDGGDVVPGSGWGDDAGTISVCSCGAFVQYRFWSASEIMGGWAWFKLNLWQRWKWRRELAPYRVRSA